MATAELPTRQKMSTENAPSDSKKTVSQECDHYKESATDYLVMRDFENCHRICLNGISFTKQYPEDSCAQACMESLCILCIQALAEMNRWPAVLPLVQDTYNGIEGCPFTVIQLCLLLHAKVGEYSQCYAIASIWLRCSDNIQLAEYKNVVTLYIRHVMMPQDQLVLVPQFLNSCTALNEKEKQDIMDKCEKLWNELKDKVVKDDEKVGAISEDDNKCGSGESSVSDKDTYRDSRLSVLVRRLGSFLRQHLSYVKLSTLFKVAILSVGLCLLAKRTTAGEFFLKNGRATSLWEGAVRILKTMFTPYRPGR